MQIEHLVDPRAAANANKFLFHNVTATDHTYGKLPKSSYADVSKLGKILSISRLIKRCIERHFALGALVFDDLPAARNGEFACRYIVGNNAAGADIGIISDGYRRDQRAV